MQEKIDEALYNVLKMIRANVKHDEALKFSQAATNLAHARQIYDALKKKASV